MKTVILIRYGEIILKGLNRPYFEDMLIKNIKKAINRCGKTKVIKSQARIYVEPQNDDYDIELAIDNLTKVFGIVSISKVLKIPTDFEIIKEQSLIMVKDLVERKGFKTFKVETKRGDKNFPMQSPEINCEIGGYLLENVEGLSVNVVDPDFKFHIEVREFTYIYSEIYPAVGGLPIGCNGKSVLLLSGGIDSPVAGWMIAKRGVIIEAVHFYSYPYTSERAKEKVIELGKLLTLYLGDINLHIVPFTDIQVAIHENCPEDESTIIMRRIMMKISEQIANEVGAKSLVTGESLGQVASQTMESLLVTNNATTLPVFRPLIGMDKNEVIDIARKINTFETSILPYEDCCTVFVAKHPKTKPRLNEIIESESKVNFSEMINEAILNTEIISIRKN